MCTCEPKKYKCWYVIILKWSGVAPKGSTMVCTCMYYIQNKNWITMSPQQISLFKSYRSSVLSYLYCELNLSSRSDLFKPSKASQGGRDRVLHLNTSLRLCASTITTRISRLIFLKKHTFQKTSILYYLQIIWNYIKKSGRSG